MNTTNMTQITINKGLEEMASGDASIYIPQLDKLATTRMVDTPSYVGRMVKHRIEDSGNCTTQC